MNLPEYPNERTHISDVVDIATRKRYDDGGGDPPMDASEELKDVQKRVTHIEAVIPTLATKADLSEAKADIVKWIVGTALAISATAITVMTFVLNNAAPKQAPSAQPPAIVINVPAQLSSAPPVTK